MVSKCTSVVILILFTTFVCSDQGSDTSEISSSSEKTIGDRPVYKCELAGNNCTFSNVFLNSTHYEWQPMFEVFYVKFTGSNISVVTKEICETFPNLLHIHMENLGIEEIKEDAFHACTELTELHLHSNRIKELHPNTFLYNTKLKKLLLYGNQIEKLDKYDLFVSLRDLEHLSVGMNNLTEFSPELVKNNKALNYLMLYSNDMSDLDAEQILDYLPNLSKFEIDDNELSCTRVVQIYKLFQSKEIVFNTTRNYKVRYYPQKKVFGDLTCNPDAPWMASDYGKEKSKFDQKINAIEIKVSDVHEKMDKQLTKVEQNVLVVIDQKVKELDEKVTKVDQEIQERLTEMDEKLEKIIALVSEPKNPWFI